VRCSSCCGALTGLLALTTTAIALFCTSSVTSLFLKTVCDNRIWILRLEQDVCIKHRNSQNMEDHLFHHLIDFTMLFV
jgi:hypothetical protein